MRIIGLQGVIRGKPVRTTISDRATPCPQDRVNRQFQAPAPNMLWVSDFTYVATWQGFVYVAFVIDTFARRIVGWRVSRTAHAGFVLDALEQALHDRRPVRSGGLVHHSHRGSQYVSIKYTERLMETGIEPSVGSVANGNPPPPAPTDAEPPEPQAPHLTMSDVTIEKIAMTLAEAAPKGVIIARDELSGWLLGLNTYNDAGRQFWLEAHGGRPFRVDRQKLAKPVIIPRLAVSVMGSTQPEKVAEMFRQPDDGLLPRFCWFWPDQRPFRLSRAAPGIEWATEALDRLRMLDLARDDEGIARPVYVPLAEAAVAMMEQFGRDMQDRQQEAGGLLRSTLGKARGLALRLSLVLAMLRWCGKGGFDAPPSTISPDDLAAACDLVADYLIPMAERVYGDATATEPERNAATLARWIRKARPEAVHVRTLQREVRLSGLNNAAAIHAAAEELIEADWLRPPPPQRGFQTRPKAIYPVNPPIVDGAS